MHHRQLRLRYTMLYTSRPRPVGDILWRFERTSAVLARPEWRPDTDVYETPGAIAVTVDVAGLAEDDFEVQLFQDALVVEGQRRLPPAEVGAMFQAVAIRQGPFRVEIPLGAAIDVENVQARYEQGLLVVTLPKLHHPERAL